MQFQADLLGVPVVRPGSPRRPRWARPIWPGWRSASGETGRNRPALAGGTDFTPAMAPDEAAELRGHWSRAVERAKGWAEPGKHLKYEL